MERLRSMKITFLKIRYILLKSSIFLQIQNYHYSGNCLSALEILVFSRIFHNPLHERRYS
jgi:hypothetical protein